MAGTPKLVITNARIFDGNDVLPVTYSVVISNGTITSISETPPTVDEAGPNTIVIDGTGCSLLPGLIDSHVHVDTPEQMDALAAHGVTAACDMACFPASKLQYIKSQSADGARPRPLLLSSGIPATSPGSTHSRLPGMPDEAMLETGSSGDATVTVVAEKFVRDRIEAGSDYIKIIADVPGPTQEMIDALVVAAHGHGRKTVIHAAATEPFRMGVVSGGDCMTHVPLDAPLDDAWAAQLKARDAVVVPTLTMMESFSAGAAKRVASTGSREGADVADAHQHGHSRKAIDFKHSLESVRVLRHAGVMVLAGTDANPLPMMAVEYGASMVRELELLILAGMEPIDALRSATSLPAEYWGLQGRGRIVVGMRADVLLVDGEPWDDIAALRKRKLVLIGGRTVS